MKVLTTISVSHVYRFFTCTMLGVVVSLGARAEETPSPPLKTTDSTKTVVIDYTEGDQVKARDTGVADNQDLVPDLPKQHADGAIIVTKLDYDHCHFDESHQHHHCYDAGEHEHAETSTYKRYSTHRPSRTYYTTYKRRHNNRHSVYNYSSRRHYSHNRRDSWDAVALGLTIGVPLAYSHSYRDRGRYGRYHRDHRNYNHRDRGNYRRRHSHRGGNRH